VIGGNGAAALGAEPHEILAGIADGGHARVRDKRAGLAVLYAGDDELSALALVVLKVADHRLFDAVKGEQPAGIARVLRRDEIDLGEHLARTLRKIGEIADRRAAAMPMVRTPVLSCCMIQKQQVRPSRPCPI